MMGRMTYDSMTARTTLTYSSSSSVTVRKESALMPV